MCICQDGFFGPSCLPCNCAKTELCDPFDGRCSCKPGYYGDSCKQRCTCFNGATCTNEDGRDCKCAIGWTESDCTVCDTAANEATFCEDRCLHCYNGDTCSISSRDCLCTPGWQGDRCDQRCEEGYHGINCSQVCDCVHGNCNPMTGTCKCKNGWTGHHCEQPCPDNCVICKDNTCISCKPGWSGVKCTNPCKPGFYGNGCKKQCPECYCTKTCHHISGSCPKVERCKNGGNCIEDHFNCECPDEWSGSVCNILVNVKVTTPDIYDNSSHTSIPLRVGLVSTKSKTEMSLLAAIMIGGIVIIITVIIVSVTVVLILKKKTGRRSPDYDEEGEYMEMHGQQQTGNISEYEDMSGEVEQNIVGEDYREYETIPEYENTSREAVNIREDYEQLGDFTRSEYQKLDLATMGMDDINTTIV
ncbi:multiple epidermal growth factor-like domains protein 11 [Ptychodera flava]|uniref:multiple epidermal growth factor-like domains protein 11 n=1 Tax=Ptychodera flava TaxID=63121 RepID=UPI00396A009E